MKVQVCLSSVGVLLGDEFGFRKQKISCEYHMSGIASFIGKGKIEFKK